MARTPEQPESISAHLAALPHLPDMVIEGGKRKLGMLVRDGNDAYQPEIALWLDVTTGVIRNTTPIDPRHSPDGGITETVDALVHALLGPTATAPAGRKARKPASLPPGLEPGLPDTVRVDDPRLALALRGLLGSLGVEIEHGGPLPAFEEAFASLSEQIGANPDGTPPEPFDWTIDSALLPPLFKATAAYARRSPWRYMPDHPPLAVSLGRHGPEDGVETIYASILGAAGEVFGISFYFDLDGLRTHLREGAAMIADDPRVDAMIEQMRQIGAPIDEVPPEMVRDLVGRLVRQGALDQDDADDPDILDEEAFQGAQVDALVFSFDPADEVDPTYLHWLAERGINFTKRQLVPSFFRSRAEQEPRDLTDREVRALTLAVEALNVFFTEYGALLSSGLIPAEEAIVEARVGTGREKHIVPVTFPAPGFDWDEDDDLPPATPEQAATLYRFQVKLSWEKTNWRRIELAGDQTLDDLHDAIQDAFGWDDDHLYSFFLSGKAWDSATEYGSPFNDNAERAASDVRLAWLPLQPKQQFLYIFDFGDDLRHLVKVEAIVPNGVEAGVQYPRLTERHGENPEQYPTFEDEQE